MGRRERTSHGPQPWERDTTSQYENQAVWDLLQQTYSYIHVYIEGIQQTLLSKASYNKYICQKKEKLQYISVGTERMFIEPSAKH